MRENPAPADGSAPMPDHSPIRRLAVMTTLQNKPGIVGTYALASGGLLVAGGVAFFAGGAMHPKEDPPDVTMNEHLRVMFEDPLWYPAHAVLLVGMALLTAALVSLVRSRSMVGGPVAAQRALVLAAVASALATVGMALHLMVAVESDALARGGSTPLVSVHVVLETITVPLFGLAVAALAAVGGATRALGNRVIAVPGVVGGLAYAAAGATIAFTDVLDPLFPVAGLIGVWAVAAGTWLLVRTRRSAAITP